MITRRRRTAQRQHGDSGIWTIWSSIAKLHTQPSHKRKTQRLSCPHWQTGAGTLWKVHWGHGTGTRHDRATKGWEYFRMGRAVRQHKSLCKGDCKQGNHFCINGQKRQGNLCRVVDMCWRVSMSHLWRPCILTSQWRDTIWCRQSPVSTVCIRIKRQAWLLIT